MRTMVCSNLESLTTNTEIRLDKNENPFETPPGLIEELRMSISAVELNRYPDQEAASLKNALSRYCGFPPDWITVGNGGDEILLHLLLAFVPRNGCMMTLSPSFSGYEQMSRSLGVRTKRIPLEFDGEVVTLREEKFIDALAASSPDLVIIDRPNNPTGLAVSTAFLMEVARLAQGIIVVDEAYVEFGGGSFLSDPENIPSNVFVLRTFSKAWGLAGLRVGWGVSNPDLRRIIDKVRSPYNVGVLPQEVARIALGYSEWMRARVNSITYTRDRFIEEVNRIPGWKALHSNANFVMLHSQCSQEMIMKTFKKMGIHTRFPDMGGLSGIQGSWVRMSVGMEEEMGVVLEAIRELAYRI